MRPYILLPCWLAACLCLSACWPAFAADGGQQMIRDASAASAARMEAFNRRDGAAVAALMDPASFIMNDGGSMATRDQLVRQLLAFRSPLDDQLGAPQGVTGRVFGDVVVLQFRYEERERLNGTEITSLLSALETWRRQAGRWQLLAKSVTPVPVNHHKAVALPASTLQDYVGTYEWRPGLREQLSLEGGRLLSRYDGGAPQEVRFAAPDVQFTDDDLGMGHVQRDAGGHVTGYRYERADGQSFEVRKLH